MNLPSDFYKQRRKLSDQIAACVLIAPELCPDRDKLPREHIADPNLKAVLRLSILNDKPLRLAVAVDKELGRYYLTQLLQIVSNERWPTQAFVWHLDYYCAQLNRHWKIESEYHDHQIKAKKFIERAARLANE